MSEGNRTVEELINLKVRLAALLSENEELKHRNNQLLRENEQLCLSSAAKDKELMKLQCLLFRLHSSWRAVSAVFDSLSNDDSSEIEKVLATNYNAQKVPSSDFRNDAVLSRPEVIAAALEQAGRSEICGTADVVDHDRQTANSKIVEQSIESSNNINQPIPTPQVVTPMESSEMSNHARLDNEHESRMKEAVYGKDVAVACAADDIIISSERQNNDSRLNTTQNNSPTIEIPQQLVSHEITAETALGNEFEVLGDDALFGVTDNCEAALCDDTVTNNLYADLMSPLAGSSHVVDSPPMQLAETSCSQVTAKTRRRSSSRINSIDSEKTSHNESLEIRTESPRQITTRAVSLAKSLGQSAAVCSSDGGMSTRKRAAAALGGNSSSSPSKHQSSSPLKKRPRRVQTTILYVGNGQKNNADNKTAATAPISCPPLSTSLSIPSARVETQKNSLIPVSSGSGTVAVSSITSTTMQPEVLDSSLSTTVQCVTANLPSSSITLLAQPQTVTSTAVSSEVTTTRSTTALNTILQSLAPYMPKSITTPTSASRLSASVQPSPAVSDILRMASLRSSHSVTQTTSTTNTSQSNAAIGNQLGTAQTQLMTVSSSAPSVTAVSSHISSATPSNSKSVVLTSSSGNSNYRGKSDAERMLAYISVAAKKLKSETISQRKKSKNTKACLNASTPASSSVDITAKQQQELTSELEQAVSSIVDINFDGGDKLQTDSAVGQGQFVNNVLSVLIPQSTDVVAVTINTVTDTEECLLDNSQSKTVLTDFSTVPINTAKQPTATTQRDPRKKQNSAVLNALGDALFRSESPIPNDSSGGNGSSNATITQQQKLSNFCENIMADFVAESREPVSVPVARENTGIGAFSSSAVIGSQSIAANNNKLVVSEPWYALKYARKSKSSAATKAAESNTVPVTGISQSRTLPIAAATTITSLHTSSPIVSTPSSVTTATTPVSSNNKQLRNAISNTPVTTKPSKVASSVNSSEKPTKSSSASLVQTPASSKSVTTVVSSVSKSITTPGSSNHGNSANKSAQIQSSEKNNNASFLKLPSLSSPEGMVTLVTSNSNSAMHTPIGQTQNAIFSSGGSDGKSSSGKRQKSHVPRMLHTFISLASPLLDKNVKDDD